MINRLPLVGNVTFLNCRQITEFIKCAEKHILLIIMIERVYVIFA